MLLPAGSTTAASALNSPVYRAIPYSAACCDCNERLTNSGIVTASTGGVVALNDIENVYFSVDNIHRNTMSVKATVLQTYGQDAVTLIQDLLGMQR